VLSVIRVAGVAVVVFVLTSCSGTSSPAPAATITVTARSTVTASPSAVGPTVTLEDCGHLVYGADGTVGPDRCPDGNINMTVDHIMRSYGYKVLELGPEASPSAVTKALCEDYATGHTTGPIEQDAYDLAKAENRWQFGINPFVPIWRTDTECTVHFTPSS
jgi:hypothetical protein